MATFDGTQKQGLLVLILQNQQDRMEKTDGIRELASI